MRFQTLRGLSRILSEIWILSSLQSFSCTLAGNESELVLVSNCTCEGYQQMYECTIVGEGATVWKGSAFNCPATNNEIVLLHNVNSTIQAGCNDGEITARIVRVQYSTFTSQLTVNIRADIIGQNITCAYDSGVNLSEIGSSTLNLTEVPSPPPTDVYLFEESSNHLSFNWSQVSSNCPDLHYRIIAYNCGLCPEITNETTVTCRGSYSVDRKLRDDNLTHDQCSFAVQTVVCGNITGDVSIPVNVALPGYFINFTTEESIALPGTSTVPTTTGSVLTPPIISVIVAIFAITLILGLVVVCCLLKKLVNLVKENTKSSDVQRSTAHVANTIESPGTNNTQSESNVIYAEIGPNSASVAGNQRSMLPLLEDSTRYAEINFSIETVFLEPQNRNELAVNLDLLLILLKDHITPRWYEFGLVVCVPKDILDSYLEYSSDQCVIEVLDYWLLHFPGHLTWNDVAQALNEVHLPQLAEKALQISTTGRLPINVNMHQDNRQSQHHPEQIDQARDDCVDDLNVSPPEIPPRTQPPPLPPKSGEF